MQLGRASFDLIISDVNMPDLDGFKLLEAARKKGIETPLVFLSADTDEEAESEDSNWASLNILKSRSKKNCSC